jgi:hypothetical protein
VLHLGVRKGAEVRKLLVGYRLSVGAALAKHARLSGLSGLSLGARWIGFYVQDAVRELAARNRPRPGNFLYLLAGAAMSFRYSVDREAQIFRTR